MTFGIGIVVLVSQKTGGTPTHQPKGNKCFEKNNAREGPHTPFSFENRKGLGAIWRIRVDLSGLKSDSQKEMTREVPHTHHLKFKGKGLRQMVCEWAALGTGSV